MKQLDIIDVQTFLSSIEEQEMPVSFDGWVSGRTVKTLATNSGSDALAFQNWRKFKEAFAPELIAKAVFESAVDIRRCLDPFGGSGTTALACQFLGIVPHTFEVNPYLADLIEAKLATYDISTLASDFAHVVRETNHLNPDLPKLYKHAPETLIEPGKSNRWIFDKDVAERVASYRLAIDTLSNRDNARLFRALLGGVLIDLSNVLVSGKGRRYRRGWEKNRKHPSQVDILLLRAVETAIGDIVRHAERKELRYELRSGDSRELIKSAPEVDLVVFSPPYPNSFDYTDVYNVELWMLGYLSDFSTNRNLRLATLTSHVQVSRQFAQAPRNSPTLERTLSRMEDVRGQLWDKRIVDMVGGYFADMLNVMHGSSNALIANGEIWMVVGDSKYAGISVPVADILCELAPSASCSVLRKEPFRSMRSSAQQGGNEELPETLIVLRRM
jgi:hypothetical protein